MRIVTFCSAYVPAYRGGTVRAIEGVAHHLAKEHDFFIIAADRQDPGVQLPGVESGRWLRTGDATVFYASRADLAWRRLTEVVSSVEPDAYYVNSLVSPRFGIIPVMLRWLRRIPNKPMVLAPRGELHPAALALKRAKKRSFIEVAKRLPAYADLLWQAGGAEEAGHIRAVFPDATIAIARDLRVLRQATQRTPRRKKNPGELSVVYLSRITPIKNLVGALRMLRRLRGSVSFSIYGASVEASYLRECIAAVHKLPSNVRVAFKGEVPHEQVLEVLAGHDVFLLPTFGESFGHAILEAMLAGCVPVISDQTPWRGLSKRRAGWDLPVDDESSFVEALQSCIDMEDSKLAELSGQARILGESEAASRDALVENIALFQSLTREFRR